MAWSLDDNSFEMAIYRRLAFNGLLLPILTDRVEVSDTGEKLNSPWAYVFGETTYSSNRYPRRLRGGPATSTMVLIADLDVLPTDWRLL
jgi:hypothetical protein